MLYLKALVVQWKDIRPWRPELRPEEIFCFLEIVNLYFLADKYLSMKQRSCDGRGGAQRPVWRGNAPKKTGARSARARTRGQNPLVFNSALYWSYPFNHRVYRVPGFLSSRPN